MTRRELIDFCLTFENAYEDYPFSAPVESGAWTVMRHNINKKCFAMIYERGRRLCVNLKCNPMDADILRQGFCDIIPAYHMNKIHWNTVMVGGDVPNVGVCDMIAKSYELIKPKERKSKRNMQ